MRHCLGGGEHVCDAQSSRLTLETCKAEKSLSPKKAQVGLQPGAVSGVPSPREAGMSITVPCLTGSPMHHIQALTHLYHLSLSVCQVSTGSIGLSIVKECHRKGIGIPGCFFKLKRVSD